MAGALLSGYSYVLHNYNQYEFLLVQLPLDELAGMHHASVKELAGCNVTYCQLLYPLMVHNQMNTHQKRHHKVHLCTTYTVVSDTFVGIRVTKWVMRVMRKRGAADSATQLQNQLREQHHERWLHTMRDGFTQLSK